MCKDYTSLEIAAFIIRSRVLAPKIVPLCPPVPAAGAQPQRKKGVETKEKYLNKNVLLLYLLRLLAVGDEAAQTQSFSWSLWGHACWKEHAVPLDGVRSSWRAWGRWQKRDNKGRSEANGHAAPLYPRPRKGKMQLPTPRPQHNVTMGPIFIWYAWSNAWVPWEKLPFIKMKMIITLRAPPLSYSELITYASVWIMHGAIRVTLCACVPDSLLYGCKLLKSFDILRKFSFCQVNLNVYYCMRCMCWILRYGQTKREEWWF